MKPHVAIVGAGWAGLACAVAAAQAGARVDVYERRTSPDTVGAHLGIAPNMMRDLARLGLAERCVRAGFPYRSIAVTDARGQIHADLPLDRLAGPQLPAAAGLKRAFLTEALLDAAAAAGVRIHWGVAVPAVAFDGERAVLEPDGAAAVAPDVALLAAGADSALAGAPFELTAAADEVTWWSGLVHRPAGLDRPTLMLGTAHRKALLVPISGDAAGLAVIDADLQSLPDDAMTDARTRAWLQAHAGPLSQARGLADDGLRLRPLRVRAVLRAGPWHHGNLLWVGDGAHVLPHHFGQSAAQSFEDAVVFGELLAGAADARTLVGAFEPRRRRRVQAVFDIADRAVRWDRRPDGRAGLAELSSALAREIAVPA